VWRKCENMTRTNIEKLKSIVGKNYVYVLENEMGLVKIGISDNPYQRFTTIENASGCRIIKYYVSSEIDNNYEIEQHMHKYYKENNTVGEWYKNLLFEDVKNYVDKYIRDNGVCVTKSNYMIVDRINVPIINIEEYVDILSRFFVFADSLKINIDKKQEITSMVDEILYEYEKMFYSDNDKITKALCLAKYSNELEKIIFHVLSVCGTNFVLESKTIFDFFNKYYGVEKIQPNTKIKKNFHVIY
jgi:predicted GIY-YIG superfamily endonuclease